MTEGSDRKPTRRMMRGRKGTLFVVEIGFSAIVIRPKGARRTGPACVAVTPDAIYERALLRKHDVEPIAT